MLEAKSTVCANTRSSSYTDRVSGVTRVGSDTRCGNWGCHPSIFSWKTGRPLLLLSLGCHPLQGGVSPFLPVRPRISTILCKFAHKFFSFGLHKIKVTNKSNHILHMFSTAARLVRAHLEFCKSRGQTQWFLLFFRHDLCHPYTLV